MEESSKEESLFLAIQVQEKIDKLSLLKQSDVEDGRQ